MVVSHFPTLSLRFWFGRCRIFVEINVCLSDLMRARTLLRTIACAQCVRCVQKRNGPQKSIIKNRRSKENLRKRISVQVRIKNMLHFVHSPWQTFVFTYNWWHQVTKPLPDAVQPIPESYSNEHDDEKDDYPVVVSNNTVISMLYKCSLKKL